MAGREGINGKATYSSQRAPSRGFGFCPVWKRSDCELTCCVWCFRKMAAAAVWGMDCRGGIGNREVCDYCQRQWSKSKEDSGQGTLGLIRRQNWLISICSSIRKTEAQIDTQASHLEAWIDPECNHKGWEVNGTAEKGRARRGRAGESNMNIQLLGVLSLQCSDREVQEAVEYGGPEHRRAMWLELSFAHIFPCQLLVLGHRTTPPLTVSLLHLSHAHHQHRNWATPGVLDTSFSLGEVAIVSSWLAAVIGHL